MARERNVKLVTQSLLDRLCDMEPWPTTREASKELFARSLKRDVEWLLNTRRPIVHGVEAYQETSMSVLCFGLEDARMFDVSAGRSTELMVAVLRECIENYEPRILSPRVSHVPTDPLNRSMRFHVEGLVRYEDEEEMIQLDTVLQLVSGEYEVD